MKLRLSKIFIIICLLGHIQASPLVTGQQIFNPLVQTLTVTNPDNFMAPPIIRLHGKQRLNINFDIIGENHEYLRWKLIHCNADWQPSRYMENEYLGNFNEVNVEDYAYSSNTYMHYVNYNISFPDPSLPILKSGNYLLQVYNETDPDIILLQARISVSEELAPIDAGVTTRTDKGTNSDYQQLFFNVDISSIPDINPYQDLIVKVTQNHRPETTKIISHPIRVMNGRAVFEHTPDLIFEAGNEYRRFETVRADYPGMNVESVDFINGMWHAWLKPDVSRNNSTYSYDRTQNGRFKIDEFNSTDPDLSADYVMVHFSLEPGDWQNGRIFVDGDFTQHRFDERNLMKYDFNDGLYHADIPLKQGSYNYQYVYIPDSGKFITTRPIEGNKYETQNEYLIEVFYRSPLSRGDRLIGTYQFIGP